MFFFSAFVFILLLFAIFFLLFCSVLFIRVCRCFHRELSPLIRIIFHFLLSFLFSDSHSLHFPCFPISFIRSSFFSIVNALQYHKSNDEHILILFPSVTITFNDFIFALWNINITYYDTIMISLNLLCLFFYYFINFFCEFLMLEMIVCHCRRRMDGDNLVILFFLFSLFLRHNS